MLTVNAICKVLSVCSEIVGLVYSTSVPVPAIREISLRSSALFIFLRIAAIGRTEYMIELVRANPTPIVHLSVVDVAF